MSHTVRNLQPDELVEERTPGALDRTSTAFGPLGAAPWCPQVF